MKLKRLVPVLMAFAMLGGVAFTGCSGDVNVDVDINGGSTSGDTTGGNTSGGDTTGGNTSGGNTSGGDTTGGDTTGGDSTGGETVADTSTPLATGKKIYVVGDSTVCTYIKDDGSLTDDYYLPRYGYGTQLAEYLNVTSDQVVNLALSGRSSKSFLSEGNYTTLVSSITTGDYLIIGFGHNDEKSAESDRFTDPAGTKDTENTAKSTSLKWCLYEKYVKMAKDKGATPILCTPITRYDSKDEYTGAKVHVTSDGDYNKAIIELGAETGTTVIDLCKLTSELYHSDNAAAAFYHAHTTYSGNSVSSYTGNETPDGRDETHINMYGAKMVAYQFAAAIAKTDCPLKAQVRTDKSAPTKENDYLAAINTAYVRPNYEAPDLGELTALMKTGAGDSEAEWYKSAFGVLGGASKVTNYKITHASGKVTIKADGGSKFAASQDGMGAVFTQVDVANNFTITAKAKVTAAATALNSQVAFGLMLRDDMLIDTNDTTLTSNFVTAGVTGDGKSLLYRQSGTLGNGGTSIECATGNEYELSISRTGQTVVVTVVFGSTTATKTFTDFDFVARDNNYMYVCLFANRGLTVEFTDIVYTVTGVSQGA